MVLASKTSGIAMTNPARTLDVSDLPDWNISNNAPLWWGQVLMATIEGVMFCMLVAAYFYLRLSVDVWPPPGTQLPKLTLPTIALVPLILSAAGSWWATEGAKDNRRGVMLTGVILNLVLGSAFLVLRFAEIQTLNFNWATDSHGTIFWSILFLHTIDVIGDLIYTLVLAIAIAIGRSGPKQRLGVHVDSVVWYFLVGIWIPLYVVLYWGPHIVGTPR
jgi:cytochrome c oxidase subunit I+III